MGLMSMMSKSARGMVKTARRRPALGSHSGIFVMYTLTCSFRWAYDLDAGGKRKTSSQFFSLLPEKRSSRLALPSFTQSYFALLQLLFDDIP